MVSEHRLREILGKKQRKKTEKSVPFYALGGGGGGGGVGGGGGGGGGVGGGGSRRSHSLGGFWLLKKLFVCLEEAPKQTFCSLLTSDILDIASNSLLKPAALSLVPQ